ncbi:MAG: GNAT family N-acetyltransferase [Halobacterium sp.]
MVVEEGARREGYGGALCDALEERARAAGFGALYLLTTTAGEFFADRGYEAVSRDEAPAAVRETAQFRDRCPATATCMHCEL